MSKKKRLVLFIASIILIIMSLFPPQKVDTYSEIIGGRKILMNSEIQYLFLSQTPDVPHYSSAINTAEVEILFDRLFLQFFAVILIAGLSLVLLKE